MFKVGDKIKSFSVPEEPRFFIRGEVVEIYNGAFYVITNVTNHESQRSNFNYFVPVNSKVDLDN